MRIDPRRLLDLLAVAKHGSFSAAAEALGVSQPGLSQSIAQLEHVLGVRVLMRDRHGARLTDYGRVLAFHSKALESLLDRVKEETRLRTLGIEGPLSIGITPIAAGTLLPRALGLLLRETPSVIVSVTEGLDDELVAMLRAREIDVVVSRLHPGVHEVVKEPLVKSDWALITRPDSPLASRASVSLREITQAQWVLPAPGSAFRRQMELVFGNAGLEWPRSGISTNSILAIKAIVMSSDCITIMSPELVEVECATGRLHAVALTDVAPLQPVGMMWRAGDDISPVAARFAKLLRFVAAESTAA
jgi:LysR family transcriptional regulator, regulator of abg operon